MPTRRLFHWLIAGALTLTWGSLAIAQQSIFHDPWLNWDFINYTNLEANDFEIVVARPNWTPPQVYTGFFPNFTTRPDPGSGGTILSWSGNGVPPGGIAHIGAAMQGSGRILGAHWTRDGLPIGEPLAIIYELTQIFPLPDLSEAVVMNLQVAPSFAGTAGLTNIRTFRDLPAELLDLDDLTSALDPHLQTPPLNMHETIPTELISLDLVGGSPIVVTQPLQPVSVLPPPTMIDSFFDVFVDVTTNRGAAFESLLTADVVAFDQSLNIWRPIGRFWNLNPQSPEPATFVLLGIMGICGVVVRRITDKI